VAQDGSAELDVLLADLTAEEAAGLDAMVCRNGRSTGGLPTMHTHKHGNRIFLWTMPPRTLYDFIVGARSPRFIYTDVRHETDCNLAASCWTL
jgi:hypothetical protein